MGGPRDHDSRDPLREGPPSTRRSPLENTGGAPPRPSSIPSAPPPSRVGAIGAATRAPTHAPPAHAPPDATPRSARTMPPPARVDAPPPSARARIGPQTLPNPAPPPAESKPRSSRDVQPSAFGERVMEVLRRYLSEPNCRAVVSAGASMARVDIGRLQPGHADMLIASAEKALGVFNVPERQRGECLSRIRTLAREALAGTGYEVIIDIEQEQDVFRARSATKDACVRLGLSDVAMTKVVTALSELARNILQYAGRGRIVVRTLSSPRQGIELIASDEGPGIPDLTWVLSPSYQSRTGMGVGLRGAKRLMDFFDVKSSRDKGTVVTLRKFLIGGPG